MADFMALWRSFQKMLGLNVEINKSDTYSECIFSIDASNRLFTNWGMVGTCASSANRYWVSVSTVWHNIRALNVKCRRHAGAKINSMLLTCPGFNANEKQWKLRTALVFYFVRVLPYISLYIFISVVWFYLRSFIKHLSFWFVFKCSI